MTEERIAQIQDDVDFCFAGDPVEKMRDLVVELLAEVKRLKGVYCVTGKPVFIVTYEDPLRWGSGDPVAVFSTSKAAEDWVCGQEVVHDYSIRTWAIDSKEVLEPTQG